MVSDKFLKRWAKARRAWLNDAYSKNTGWYRSEVSTHPYYLSYDKKVTPLFYAALLIHDCESSVTLDFVKGNGDMDYRKMDQIIGALEKMRADMRAAQKEYEEQAKKELDCRAKT